MISCHSTLQEPTSFDNICVGSQYMEFTHSTLQEPTSFDNICVGHAIYCPFQVGCQEIREKPEIT